MEHFYCTRSYRHIQGAASFTYFSDQSMGWDFSIGVSVASVWPEDMSIPMNPESPEDLQLIDCPYTGESVILASPRLRAFLESQELPNLEFLPITLLDHKGRTASRDYSVLQCCHVIDCIDQNKSEFEWNGLSGTKRAMDVEEAIFDPQRLGPNDRLFRCKYVPAKYVFRDDLAREIKKQDFKGLNFSREFFGDFGFSGRDL